MLLAHHKTFPTVKDQISIRLTPVSIVFAMVRNSVSKHIPKSQPPLPKAPSGPFGNGLVFLVFQRARQAFLSFAFPLFQASGDNNTKDFSQSQVELAEESIRPSLTDYALDFSTPPFSVSSLSGVCFLRRWDLRYERGWGCRRGRLWTL